MAGIVAQNPNSVVPANQPSPGNVLLLSEQIQSQSSNVQDSTSVALFGLTSQAFSNLQNQINQIMQALRAPLPHEEQLSITDSQGNMIGWIGYEAVGGQNYEGAWFADLYLGGTGPADALITFTLGSDIVIFNDVSLTTNNSYITFDYAGPGFQQFVVGGPGAIFTFNPYATGGTAAFQYQATSGGFAVIMNADGLFLGTQPAGPAISMLPTSITLTNNAGDALVTISEGSTGGSVSVVANTLTGEPSATLSATATSSTLVLNDTTGAPEVTIDTVSGYSSVAPLQASLVTSNGIFVSAGQNGLNYTATLAGLTSLTFTGGLLTGHTP